MKSLDATERIRRLLILIPEVVRAKDGVHVSKLAEKLGVEVEELPSFIERLMLVGKPPFNPDDLIELYIEDERVFAALHQSLNRPPRLTHDEALALAVGAKYVRTSDDGGPAESSALESALAKLEGAMTEEELARYKSMAECIALGQGSISRSDVRSVLWSALENAQAVAMTYYSAYRDVLTERVVEPYGILSHSGYWYLVAGPDGPEGYKLYRFDRIRQARPTGEVGAVRMPLDLDLDSLGPGGFNRGLGSQEARRIRLKKGRARFVLRLFADEQIEILDDGSVIIHFGEVLDEWLSSFVMSLGGDAKIIGPDSLRQKVLGDARRTRARYDDT